MKTATQTRLPQKLYAQPSRKSSVAAKKLNRLTRTPTARNTPKGTVTVTCSALNVRADANAQSERIGGLICGQTASYSEEKNGWLKIAYKNTFGWINAQYTDYKKEEEEPPKTFDSFDVRVTASSGLNLRDNPGTSGTNVLTVIPSGTRLTVTDEKNGWYHVEYNGKSGWISADYTVKVQDVTPDKQKAVELAQKYIGEKTHDLVGIMPFLTDISWAAGSNNGYDLNCANFVSACLEYGNLTSKHCISVSDLKSTITAYGYRTVSRSAARPGDVWIASEGSHTELVEYGTGSDTVHLIGSNNIESDVQYVSRAKKTTGTIYTLD